MLNFPSYYAPVNTGNPMKIIFERQSIAKMANFRQLCVTLDDAQAPTDGGLMNSTFIPFYAILWLQYRLLTAWGVK